MIGSYVRRHHVALLALFIALSGTAYATTIAPTNSVVSKSIKNRQVKSVDVKNNGLTGTDINEGTLGTVPRATNAGNADSLQGHHASAFLPAGGTAANASALGGSPPDAFGAVLGGRISSLSTGIGIQEFAPLMGVAGANSNIGAVDTLSPNRNLTLRDFSVRLTHAPGSGAQRAFLLAIENGSVGTLCTVVGSATGCNSGSQGFSIPANSAVAIVASTTLNNPPAAADAMFGLRLTP